MRPCAVAQVYVVAVPPTDGVARRSLTVRWRKWLKLMRRGRGWIVTSRAAAAASPCHVTWLTGGRALRENRTEMDGDEMQACSYTAAAGN